VLNGLLVVVCCFACFVVCCLLCGFDLVDTGLALLCACVVVELQFTFGLFVLFTCLL